MIRALILLVLSLLRAVSANRAVRLLLPTDAGNRGRYLDRLGVQLRKLFGRNSDDLLGAVRVNQAIRASKHVALLLALIVPLSSVAVAQMFMVGERPSVEAKAKPPKPPPDSIIWAAAGTTQGVGNNYYGIVVGSAVCVYANTDGATNGRLYRSCGTWSSVGPAQVVLTTYGQDAYIRTIGVAKGASGTLYAVLYVGPCYGTGCVGGFSPAWATSNDDGVTWNYRGRISPFGINQSSAGAIVVDESRTDDYRFMVWLDIGPSLYLIHSATGESGTWVSDGLNQWPIANEQPQFCSAAKTPFGVHMICANAYPATALRHVFSCTSLPPWRVLEMASDVINTQTGKGTSLVYDSATGLINALTSGKRWTLPASAYPC